MNTRGAPDSASAPSSPSSRVNVAPSDSDPPAESPDVVDVTCGEEPWTATSARRTSDPPPLRASKRTSGKAVAGAASADARKGKKRLTRQQASAGGTTPKKSAREASKDSEADLEEKPAPLAAKKAKKTTSEATSAPTTDMQGPSGSRAERGAGQGFNLDTFMASFASSRASAESAPTVERAVTPVVPPPSLTPDILAELQALRDEVMRLRGVVAASRTTVDDGAAAVTATATAPNARGELPPHELRYLPNSNFPDGWKKAKGDYNLLQTHLLAASRMFRMFGSGKHISAMAFVLSLRELECVRFQASPAVLMAIFSGRLGSRGLTLMHFKEASEMECLEDGSANVNFASDFSAAANLPAVSIKCSTYEDILDAVHGLNAFGQEVWYDHMRKVTSRLRAFVARNKSADPGNTPARVRLTLLYANKFLGTALGHLQADDPQWWAGFCDALRGIDYQSTAWTMALVGVLTQTPDDDARVSRPRARQENDGRRETHRRPPIPDSIRRLISINRRGQEPCLLNVAGLPCSGGTAERCGNPRRMHKWPDALPTRLQE